MDREALRAQTTDLLNRLRELPEIPHPLFELLDVFARRLDRIELGEFGTMEETPTKPDRKSSQTTIPAVRETPFEKVAQILEEAKKI